jgi:hypothetical protein
VGRQKTSSRDPRIQTLRQEIERWRRTGAKRTAMPEALWRRALELARELGVYGAAQALGVSYDSLRKRAEAAGVARRRPKQSQSVATTTFVELAPTALPVGVARSGPVVEVTGPRGQKLTVRLPAEAGGEFALLGLVRECWSGRE